MPPSLPQPIYTLASTPLPSNPGKQLSKLTIAGKVWRGTCYGVLPHEFWVEDQCGVLGGIEFGFQSTTRIRDQAVHYAKGGGHAKPGEAMTLFEINMGMIDRGAELSWFSQCATSDETTPCPHHLSSLRGWTTPLGRRGHCAPFQPSPSSYPRHPCPQPWPSPSFQLLSLLTPRSASTTLTQVPA